MSVVALLAVLLTQPSTMAANVELYGGLKTGMSKAEAEAALPAKERLLTTTCQMVIKKVYDKDRLVSVHLRNKWSLEKSDCHGLILSSLVEKYGQPSREETTPGVGSIIPEGSALIWEAGERVVTLSRRGEGTAKKTIALSYSAKITDPAPAKIPDL